MAVLCSACTLEPPPPPRGRDSVFAGRHAPAANLTEERVAAFDPSIDYFPQKTTFEHARYVSVEYHNHYKVATIRLGDVGQQLQVLMVQRGTPVPTGYPDAEVVWVPVRRWALGSWHYGGIADLLGVADRLVYFANFRNATSPGLVRLIKQGRLREYRSVEQTVDLGADIYIRWTPYLTLLQDLDQYRALGITAIPMAEHLERTVLGRAEWIKLFGMFFNREAAAEAHFTRVAGEYERLAALAHSVRVRPRVLVNIPAGNHWAIYGGRNVAARMITDAGGSYVFADNPTAANRTEEWLERAYDRGLDADIWLIGPDFSTRRDLPDLIATNPYTRQLPATRRGAIYVCHNGAPGAPNIYWDQGLPNPHWELADHIKMLHPDLLPDHELVFYRRLSGRPAPSMGSD